MKIECRDFLYFYIVCQFISFFGLILQQLILFSSVSQLLFCSFYDWVEFYFYGPWFDACKTDFDEYIKLIESYKIKWMHVLYL